MATKRPLQFRSIPPLASSSTRVDKENQRQLENSKPSSEGTKAKTAFFASSHFSPSRQKVTAAAEREPLSAHVSTTLDSRSSLSPPLLSRTQSQGNKRRVLRYGETLDSLFCFTEQTPSSHRRLCQDIVLGPLADDPASWRRVLEVASKEVTRSRTDTADQGADLIRLHRRATSRFSPYEDYKTCGNEDDILALWLSYARAQATFGSAEEARLMFRHVQNQRLGLTNASFYLELSKFEETFDKERAKQALRTGLEQRAEPMHELTNALRRLEASTRKIATTRSPTRDATTTIEKPALAFHAVVPQLTSRNSLGSGSDRKRKTEEDTSPKRRKNNDGTGSLVLPPSSEKSINPQTESNENLASTERIRIQARRVVRPSSLGSSTTQLASNPPITSNGPQTNKRISPVLAPTRKLPTDSSTFRQLSLSSTKSTQSRPPLLTKTPRLSRAGLSGKAQRVNPDAILHTDSEDDGSTMDTTGKSETIDLKLLEKVSEVPDLDAPKPAPRLKMDLSYMMNWDPNDRRKQTSDTTANSETSHSKSTSFSSFLGPSMKPRTPAMEKIDEASQSATGSGETSVVTTSTHSNGTKSLGSNESHLSDRTCHSQVTTRIENNAQPSFTFEPSSNDKPNISPDIADLVAKSNTEFLPLVCEDNTLRVNSVPYAKLGVIGKGGSCKVYRALSKDCAIVAIKKVKLKGMDKKSISGYANEIALLKRLRGNPCIIQMFDSEVDLARKAIFVVMELGEVDLNHVIQQQTGKDGEESKRQTLDMNFIRLTWQQMLKAVHSIHEERIIHGDLKPANFLFVRGALKLIDFGIAKAIQGDETSNIYRDTHVGTLNYMSPEAIQDSGTGTNGARMRIGRPSDIWSLGCILYQMVYGRTPFADLKLFQKMQAIADPNYKINFPDDVEDIGAVDAIKLCLRRNPDERPPIVGPNGLLNEHYFLHTRRRNPCV